jgi:hypothetical protein
MASLSSKASLRTTRVVSERLTLALTLTINIASSSFPVALKTNVASLAWLRKYHQLNAMVNGVLVPLSTPRDPTSIHRNPGCHVTTPGRRGVGSSSRKT